MVVGVGVVGVCGCVCSNSFETTWHTNVKLDTIDHLPGMSVTGKFVI